MASTACVPSAHLPHRLCRSRQAQAMAKGHSTSHGQPPSSISITGTLQPRSLPSPASKSTRPAPSPPHSQSAPAPLFRPCQRCHARPGISPAPNQAASGQRHHRLNSLPQRMQINAADAAGSRRGALRRSMKLLMSPAPSARHRSMGLRSMLKSRNHNKAMALS